MTESEELLIMARTAHNGQNCS